MAGVPVPGTDPTAFVFPADRTIGSVGRNTLMAPGFSSLDFSLTKETHVVRM